MIDKPLTTTESNSATDNESQVSGLIDGPRLLEQVWPDPLCRPSLRWLRTNQRMFPHIRLGRLIYFNLDMVREHLRAAAMKKVKAV